MICIYLYVVIPQFDSRSFFFSDYFVAVKKMNA